MLFWVSRVKKEPKDKTGDATVIAAFENTDSGSSKKLSFESVKIIRDNKRKSKKYLKYSFCIKPF